jgi:hypothetical protein
VEARQRAQLTGTNRSTGLIRSHYQTPLRRKKTICFPLLIAGLVAFGEAIRPDPIPNSAVKRFRANGTMSQDLGE